MIETDEKIAAYLEAAGVRLWPSTIARWSDSDRADVLVWCDAAQDNEEHPRPTCIPPVLSFHQLRNAYRAGANVLFPFSVYGEKIDSEVAIIEYSTSFEHRYLGVVLELKLYCDGGAEIRAKFTVHADPLGEKMVLVDWQATQHRPGRFRVPGGFRFEQWEFDG